MSDPQNLQSTTNLQDSTDNSVGLNSENISDETSTISTSQSDLEIDSTLSSDTTKKSNKTPLIVAGVIGGLMLVGVVAGIGLSNSPKESKSAQNTASSSPKSSGKSETAKGNTPFSQSNSQSAAMVNSSTVSTANSIANSMANSQNPTSDSESNSVPNAAPDSTTNSVANPTSDQAATNSTVNNQNASTNAPANNSPVNQNSQNASQAPVLTESQIKANEESKVVDKFFEIKATNEKLNLNPVTMTKEDAKVLKGDESNFAIPAAVGKKFRVTLDYSNAGDMDFEKATLIVNVDKALKILPGTIKDTFEGKSVTVNDSLFKDNQMKYGPGTSDKDMSEVKVGQKGKMTIDVEVPANTAPGDYRIATTLENPDGGKPGIPGIFFLTVK